ncbi:MAG: hypothetical protein ACYSU7_11120 [Planctomycetota bacterium]|jgi:hypothetical protein
MAHRGWKRRVLTGVTLAVLGAIFAVTAGCPLPSSRELAVQWAAPMKEMGLLVVDPPQEDVRVGDVYVFAESPEPQSASAAAADEQPRIGRMGRWLTLPVLAEVESEFRQRPDWPQTPVTVMEAQERRWFEPTSTGEQSIFASDTTPTRLRGVSLTGMSGTMTGRGEATALVPAELDNLIPGTSFEDYKGITVSVSSADTYSLALESVLGVLVDENMTGDAPRYVVKEQYRRFLPLMGRADSEVVYIRVVSEVIYMRSMDYTIQPAQPPDSVEDVPPPDMTSVRAPPPEAVMREGDPAVIPFRRADEINRLLTASSNDRLPGGVTRLLSVTDGSVSLRRTWSRGLAIAVRGLTLELDKNTGAVLRLGAMGAPMPKRSTAEPGSGS